MENNEWEKKSHLLIDWSKWLIGINLFAATGCVIGLKTAVQPGGITGVLFFLAVACFMASACCAALLVFLLSASLHRQKWNWLALIQLSLFVMGVLFVLAWVAVLSQVFI